MKAVAQSDSCSNSRLYVHSISPITSYSTHHAQQSINGSQNLTARSTFDSTAKPASAAADSLLLTAADIGARGFLKPADDTDDGDDMADSFCMFCTLAHRSISYTMNISHSDICENDTAQVTFTSVLVTD